MKNVLIIGGDSFIAQTFIKKNRDNYSFTLVSRKNTGYTKETILDDFFDIDDSLFNNIDLVINFAAIVHQPNVTDAELYDKINHQLPVYLANKAKENKAKHFIQMSTIAVYDQSEAINANSDTVPSTLYGISKLKADTKILKLNNDKFIVSCIRPPMVYGGGSSPGNMLKLLKLASKGVYLPFKNVNNKRDFININNLFISINSIINNSLSGVLIPTDEKAVSTEEIIKTICHISGNKERLFPVPKFILSILMKIKPSIFKKVYGSLLVECNIDSKYYQPKYSLYEGLRDIHQSVENKK